jgi:hypothetical protein
MKYYKDENNRVYAYESDGSQDEFIPEGLVLITNEEMEQLIKPPKEQVIANNEQIKQSLINEASIQIEILRDAIEFDDESEETESNQIQLKKWRKYRVLLSKIDINSTEIDWPEKPI